MGYLVPGEYEAYGLAVETPEAWVTAASAMMEAHCRRATLLEASYTERLPVGRRTGGVRLTYGPVNAVTALRARFASDANGLVMGESMLADAARAFCAAGTWTDVDVTTLDIDARVGEVRPPVNLLGAAYRECEVTYTAGFVDVPVGVKVACAQIVKNAQATPGLNVKASRVDTLQMTYFSDQLLDAQVKALLRPYVAERLT